MGFSLVSLFEILYHAIGAFSKWWRSVPKISRQIPPRSPWDVRGIRQPLKRASKSEMEMSTITTNNGGAMTCAKNRAGCTDSEDKMTILSKIPVQNISSDESGGNHQSERLL